MQERAIYRKTSILALATATFFAMVCIADAQRALHQEEDEFGPVVRAYLKYLDDEQNVVDDRVSRHEVSAAYYRRNSARIHALRAMAIRIARETGNDYLPELEAATQGELKTLFERPPSMAAAKTGEILNNTFRYLGAVRVGETFYLFARLDPYEQADLMKKSSQGRTASQSTGENGNSPESAGRPRRAKSP
jgi:hypothetical protein